MADEKQTLHISLVPEGGESFRPVNIGRRKVAFVFYLLMCLAVIVVSVVLLKAAERRAELEIKVKQDEIAKIKNEAERLTADYGNVAHLDKQLKAAKILLAGHPSFNGILKLIEDKTLPEVYYSNFLASYDGRTIVLEVKAKDFEDAAKQIVAFRSDTERVERVSASTLTANIDAAGVIKDIKFTLTIVARDNAFH